MNRLQALDALRDRYGSVRLLGGSQSLAQIGDSGPVIYLRYSKVHPGGRGFYGLREVDLARLDTSGVAFLAFLWDRSPQPLLLPWNAFRGLVRASPVAVDGQRKAQILDAEQGPQLYLAQAGRHSVEAYLGWSILDETVSGSDSAIPLLTHQQVQTIIGSIGARRGFDVWVPVGDRTRLDWTVAPEFSPSTHPPALAPGAEPAIAQIDVLWLVASTATLFAAFEIEHSTPIYSGLLRFNDVLLSGGRGEAFNIVAEDHRRADFVRQIGRPTFVRSGLSERCGFLTNDEVYRWLRAA